MKKYWLEIILILAIVSLFCGMSCADEFDSAIMISCAKHGELAENKVATLIVDGEEHYICLKCVNDILTCLMELYENNQEEIDSIIKEAIIQMKGSE